LRQEARTNQCKHGHGNKRKKNIADVTKETKPERDDKIHGEGEEGEI